MTVPTNTPGTGMVERVSNAIWDAFLAMPVEIEGHAEGFQAQARAAMAQCCKELCAACASGEQLAPNGHWVAKSSGNKSGKEWITCLALPIRDALSEHKGK